LGICGMSKYPKWKKVIKATLVTAFLSNEDGKN
jgi:hypothetical protein